MLKRLVPAIASLLMLAGTASAVDGVAPVTILPIDDNSLNPATPVIVGSNPAAVIDLDAVLASTSFAFNWSFPAQWTDFQTGFVSQNSGATIDTAHSGVAVVDTTGQGTWQFRNNGSWTDIDSAAETNAWLLALSVGGYATQLRFVPDVNASDGTATLSFRIWDGSDATTSTANVDPFAPQPYGGSPTAFSAETRQLTVTIDAANSPPAIIGDVSDPTIIAGVPTRVSDLLATTTPFIDPNADPIGIALTSDDTVDSDSGTWAYQIAATPDPAGWTTLVAPGLSGQEAPQALLLAPDTWIRWLPTDPAAVPPANLLSIHAWDGHDGAAGDIVVLPTTHQAISANSIVVDVLQDNAPAIGTINGQPALSVVLTVTQGTTQHLTATASDPDSGDILAWSAAVNNYSAGSVSVPSPASGFSTGLDYTAPNAVTSTTITLTATDQAGLQNQVTFTVNVVANHVPVISTAPITRNVAQGLTAAFTADATDADADPLTWSVVGTAYSGTAVLGTSSGTHAAGTYHATGAPGTDNLQLQVDDGRGGIVTVPLTVTVTANAPPTLGSSIGTLAVAGQPYDSLITVVDADSPAIALSNAVSAYSGSLPAWLSFTHNQGRGHLTGTPPANATGSFTMLVTVSDEYSNITSMVTVTIVPPQVGSLDLPTLATSTPSAPTYALIAPGSSAGFASVNTTFAGLFPSQARGLWWSAGYVDLPTLPPVPTSAGVFLATTVPKSLDFSTAPAQALPFVISLAAGSGSLAKWHLIGVPPVVVDAEPIIETSHPWADFRLDTADGIPVSDESAILSVLATGSGSNDVRIQPLTWDSVGGAYVRSDIVLSGRGYWVPNFDSADYRLVRTTSSDPYRLGALVSGPLSAPQLATHAIPAAIATRAWPPPPPGGSAQTATAADGHGNGCGAGGLAGLLAAALACFGLRRGRRG